MTQRESRLSRDIQNALRGEGAFCFKVWGNDHTMAGLPDIVVCVDGKFLGLEVKLPESRRDVSKIQRLRHAQIEEAGGVVRVVCSRSEALAELQKIRNP